MRVGRLPLSLLQTGDIALAEAVRGFAGQHHAVLLANHGQCRRLQPRRRGQRDRGARGNRQTLSAAARRQDVLSDTPHRSRNCSNKRTGRDGPSIGEGCHVPVEDAAARARAMFALCSIAPPKPRSRSRSASVWSDRAVAVIGKTGLLAFKILGRGDQCQRRPARPAGQARLLRRPEQPGDRARVA